MKKEFRKEKKHSSHMIIDIVLWGTMSFCVIILITLLSILLHDGWSGLSLDFLTNFPSRKPQDAGIFSALIGSIYMISLTIIITIPIGIATAIYIQEYAQQNRITHWLEIVISNLAGVPSIVYGMLGLVIFVRWFFLGRSLLAGSLTMSLVILPIVIISAREALRAVPQSLRNAAYALGAERWQVVFSHVLPHATSLITTGVILAISRAIGETAPLVMIGALTYVAFVPENLLDSFTTLPVQIYNWVSRPQPEFHSLASAGILVLLAMLLILNTTAIIIRYRRGTSS